MRWSAGTIKLPFRKLNSILCEQVERAAGTSVRAREDARLDTPSTGQSIVGSSVVQRSRLCV